MPKQAKSLSAISQVEGKWFCPDDPHSSGGHPLQLPRARRLFQPVDFDFLFQRLEFRVAGDEFGFLFLRQRRKKSSTGVADKLGFFQFFLPAFVLGHLPGERLFARLALQDPAQATDGAGGGVHGRIYGRNMVKRKQSVSSNLQGFVINSYFPAPGRQVARFLGLTWDCFPASKMGEMKPTTTLNMPRQNEFALF